MSSTSPLYSGELSFMRTKYSQDYGNADIVVIGVPFDSATSNRPGTRLGPRAIRQASSMIAWEKPYYWSFHPFHIANIIDSGDIDFDYGNITQIPEKIKTQALRILQHNTALFTLGGDHFITYPLLQAHYQKYQEPLSLIQFDAHTDTWYDSQKRIDHGTMFYHAIQEKIINPNTSVQIGIRTHNENPLGISIIDAQMVHNSSPKDIATQIHHIVKDSPVYLTFDIDCLDPAYAPGTGTPTCGGLTTAQVMNIIQLLKGIKLVGMDVVEVSPPYDTSEVTALAAATIATEIICLYLSQ